MKDTNTRIDRRQAMYNDDYINAYLTVINWCNCKMIMKSTYAYTSMDIYNKNDTLKILVFLFEWNWH